ncbi:hypothetical protein MRX96_059189 [Rhipicephalus microplus]
MLPHAGLYTVGLDCLLLAFASTMACISTSMATVRSLLMTMLLSGRGGVLIPVNFEGLAECGHACGGIAWRPCVDECHCVFESGDYGRCLPHGVNNTLELPLDHGARSRQE